MPQWSTHSTSAGAAGRSDRPHNERLPANCASASIRTVAEVPLLERQVGQEQVPWHVAQRRCDPLVADPASLQDLAP